MHRNRTWQIDPEELRTQRNRILPIEGGDGSALSLDFTTGVLDPRLTFARTSNATFINSLGYVQYADANLITFSEEFTGSGWGVNQITLTTPSVTNPIGGPTCTLMTVAGSGGSKSVSAAMTIAQGFRYTFRVWVKAASSSIASFGYYIGAGFADATLTKISGDGTIQGSGSGANYQSITGLTSNWTLVQLTLATTTTSGAGAWYIYPNIGSQAIGDSIHVWGAQANIGATANPYYRTGSSAYQAPRFDYNPTTLQSRGLLIEAQVQNPVTGSQTLNAAAWLKAATTISETGTGSPANDSTSNVLTWTNGTAVGSAYTEQSSLAVSASQPYTWSVWLKNRGNQRVSVFGFTKTSTSTFSGNLEMTVDFSVATPTATITTSTNFTSTSVTTPVAFGNGWYRCTMTGTTPSTAAVTGFGISNKDAVPASGTNGCEVWGAQLEAGSGASSYIPTGASQGTREADSAVMNDISPLNYSTTNGSIYWSGIINKQPTSYITLVGFMTAIDEPAYETFGNGLSYFTAARGPTLNVSGPNEVSRPYVLGSLIKYASSVNTLQDPIVAVNLNGSASSTNKSGTGNLRVATRFVIGRQLSSTYGVNYPSITIRSIKYWPTSKVAAELAVLTA